MKPPKFIRDWFTEDDAGKVWSLAHALGGCSVIAYIGMAGWHTVTMHQFDAAALGTGLAAVLAASAALIFANSRSGTKKDV